MSRLSAAQVITLGEYLNDDFDPSILTISQLLGVFGFHNVKYPTPHTKNKLVQVFNDEIKANNRKLKAQRLARESSVASDDGIRDGVTGLPLSQPPAPRRSSRRSSRAPSQEAESDVATTSRPEPPKRRRSSAQPSLERNKLAASKHTFPTGIAEESEPEEVLPVRKVGRSKKGSKDAATQSRRVSEVDSGWEDNNIFQSGAESSSPVKPTPAKARSVRRSSVLPRKTPLKATSAPPETSSPLSSPTRPLRITQQSPPESKFEPELPAQVLQTQRAKILPLKYDLTPSPVKATAPVIRKPSPIQDIIDVAHDDNDDDDDAELAALKQSLEAGPVESELVPVTVDQEVAVVQADEDPDVSIDTTLATLDQESESISSLSIPRGTPVWLRVCTTLILAVCSVGVWSYKQDSASLGFCETGSFTNQLLEDAKIRWAAEEACNLENRTLLYLPSAAPGVEQDQTPCPPPALIPIPHPSSCTPCPEHAQCTAHSVTCDTGYLLRPHPLLFLLSAHPNTSSVVPLSSLSPSTSPSDVAWRLVTGALDGLPGFGPVALPPRCVADPRRKRNIGSLAKAMDAWLAQQRGQRLCESAFVSFIRDADGGEAKRWGVSLQSLKDFLRPKNVPQLLATYDDTFNEAVQELVHLGSVFIGEDSGGNRYIAHTTPELTWTCSLTVKGRNVWMEWRSTVISILLGLVGLYAARLQRQSRQVENKKVAKLVQIALDTLRNQELAHHADPVETTRPYLSSLQLRDAVLSEEHSVKARQRLWARVERIVESNANVRTNLEEVPGGDELRVWRWVGGGGATGYQTITSVNGGETTPQMS